MFATLSRHHLSTLVFTLSLASSACGVGMADLQRSTDVASTDYGDALVTSEWTAAGNIEVRVTGPDGAVLVESEWLLQSMQVLTVRPRSGLTVSTMKQVPADLHAVIAETYAAWQQTQASSSDEVGVATQALKACGSPTPWVWCYRGNCCSYLNGGLCGSCYASLGNCSGVCLHDT